MILDVLNEDVAEVGIKAKDKKELIAKMLEIACRSGKVKDKKKAARDLEARENLSSTGMQHGMAIPHAKTDAVDELVASIGVSENPIPFDSLDGKPARVFLMTLSPVGRAGEHIRFLTEIAKLLRDDTRRNQLLQATNNTQLLQALKE